MQTANPQKSFSLHAMNLPWAADWDTIFGRSAPLIVEIGFGNGKFLASLAQQHPDANIIGIERAHQPLTWTEKLIQQEKLSNVRLVNATGLMAVTCLFQPASLDTVHMNFSDPWHKRRHWHRRLVNADLLCVLVSRIQPGGHIYIATDITPYAENIYKILNQTPGIANAYVERWMNRRENPTIVTRYEQKAVQAGRTCYYFKWRRTDNPVDSIPVYEELTPMPNANIALPLSLDHIAESFQPMTGRYQDRVVNIMQVYQEVGKQHLLFETLVQEPLFDQRVMISLSLHHSGSYLLQLSAVGYPRATRGMHDAVHHLLQWLLSLDPQAHIVDLHVKVPHS